MFTQTAGFLQQCAQACFKHKEDELKGALFLKWAAICFARSFHIKRERLKQNKKDLAAFLTQQQQQQTQSHSSTNSNTPSSSAPTSTSSSSTSTPPTIPSPASTPPSPGPTNSTGSAYPGSASMIQKNLQTLEDMYELVKMTELWSRSEIINSTATSKLDPLPDFVNIDTAQAIDYVKSQVSKLKK